LNDTEKKILTSINEDEVISYMRDLVEIPSHENLSVEEYNRIVPPIKNKLESLGMKVEIYDAYQPSRDPERKKPRPVIVGTLKGTKGSPVLMLNAHPDVVPIDPRTEKDWKYPVWELIEVDGKYLYGRGAADMKGALAAMIMAIEAIVKSGVKMEGDLVMVSPSLEEVGNWGSGELVKIAKEKGMKFDAAIVGEPTNLEVHPATNGIMGGTIVVKGLEAHGSTPWAGINAIIKMGDVITALGDYAEKLKDRRHPLCGYTLFVPSLIEGGFWGNAVPGTCTLRFTTHYPSGVTQESHYAEIRSILDQLKQKDPQLNVELLQRAPSPSPLRSAPTEIPVDHPVVKASIYAHQIVTGKKGKISGSTYQCDITRLVHEGNIPSINFGPGTLDTAHAPNEMIEKSQVITATKLYAITALKYLKEAS
jgi:acetylornithine deacetylase/succinyl-diaminopimelate desuccinylase family protein